MTTVGLPIVEPEPKAQYKECVNEFQQVMSNFMDANRSERVDVASRKNSFEQIIEDQAPPTLPPRKRTSIEHHSLSRENSIEQTSEKDDNKENMQSSEPLNTSVSGELDENKISVKEAMMKFNRFASEEEAKIPSPLSKASKKPTEKVSPMMITFFYLRTSPSILGQKSFYLTHSICFNRNQNDDSAYINIGRWNVSRLLKSFVQAMFNY